MTLVSAGAGVARSVERALAARDLLNPRTVGEGTAVAAAGGRVPTASNARATPNRFASSARASCRCRSARSSESRCRDYRGSSDERTQLRARSRRTASGHDRAGIRPHGVGVGADLDRGDEGHLHGFGAGERSPLARRARDRLGHRRVRNAPGVNGRAQAARCDQGPGRRSLGRDPAPDRALAARRHRLRGARRADDLHRLRRSSGRWRHPLRVDHRGHGGAATRDRSPDPRAACSSARR